MNATSSTLFITWHWLPDNTGKLCRSLEMNFTMWDKLSFFYYYFFHVFFFSPRGCFTHLFFALHLSVLVLIDMVHSPMGAAKRYKSNASFHSVIAMPWGLCILCAGESVCHRTNTEKVGHKGAPRWKGGGVSFFPSCSSPCSLYLRSCVLVQTARDNKMTPPTPYTHLLFSSNSIFALSFLLIYTFFKFQMRASGSLCCSMCIFSNVPHSASTQSSRRKKELRESKTEGEED